MVTEIRKHWYTDWLTTVVLDDWRQCSDGRAEMRGFGAVVVFNEIDLISRYEYDIRQHAERTGLADYQVGAVMIGRHGRQTAAAAGRRVSAEIVTRVGERSVGADRKVSGVQL